MSCDCQTPKDCCQDCPSVPAPILPRCDIALPDGVFTNATVAVEDGCIVSVTDGRPAQYTPDPCCAPVGGGGGGGGGGGDGPPGQPGPPGAAATISVGTVTTLPPGTPATIVNVGTENAAVFNFGIPRGATGAGGGGGGGGAGMNISSCGWEFVDGLLTNAPLIWKPVSNLEIEMIPPVSGVNVAFQLGAAGNGCHDKLTFDFTSLRNEINTIKGDITSINGDISDLQDCCENGGGGSPPPAPVTKIIPLDPAVPVVVKPTSVQIKYDVTYETLVIDSPPIPGDIPASAHITLRDITNNPVFTLVGVFLSPGVSYRVAMSKAAYNAVVKGVMQN